MRARAVLAGLATLALCCGIAWADAPKRIVSLGGGVTATVYALGFADQVVAIDTSAQPPPGKQLPRVGYVRTVAAEGILALKPDLVVAPDSFGPPVVKDQLKAAGVRLEILPEVKTVAAAGERFTSLGALLGVPDKAKALTDALAKADAETPTLSPARRVMFLFVHGSGPLQAAGKGTRAAAIIDAVGATNAVEGFEGYRPLTPEAAVASRADVLLTTTRAMKAAGGEAAFWRTPGLGLTPAGQKKTVIVMDDLALLGFGPRLADTLRTLHARLK